MTNQTVEQLEWQLNYYQERLAEQPGDGMFLKYISDTRAQLEIAKANARGAKRRGSNG